METTEPKAPPQGDRLSVAEAAELLAVHPNTIRHRLRKGHYPAEQVWTPYGPAYAIPRAAVEADLATQGHDPPNKVGADVGEGSASTALSAPMSLTVALEGALAPLVEELARARADAAAAHERAGRLQAERDEAVLQAQVERTRRYEREQRRPWWRFW